MNYRKIFGLISVRGISVVISMIFMMLISKHYSKEAVGDYFFFVQVVMLSSVLVKHGTENALLKYAHDIGIGDLKNILSYDARISLAIFVVIAVLMHIINYISLFFSDYLHQLLLCVLPMAVISYVGDYYKGINRQQVGIGIQTTLLPLILLMFFFLDFDNIKNLYFSSTIVTSFFVVIFFFFNKSEQTNKNSVFIDYKRSQGSFFIISVLNMSIASLDVMMLKFFSSSSDIAEYALTSRLVLLSSLILIVINSVISPAFSRIWRSESKDKKKEISRLYIKSSLFMLVLAVTTFLFFVFLGKPLIKYLYGVEYITSYKLLVILAAGQLIVLATGPIASLLMMTDNANIHKRSLFIAFLVNVIFNILLIPSYGAVGAAISMCLSLVFKNIFSLYYVESKLKIIESLK